jgi:hypothetical protein
MAHKYNARATVLDGQRFASAAEARRYGELYLLQRAGAISHLQLQPRFPCVINGLRICIYVADFSYCDPRRPGSSGQVGCTVVEDVKGVATPLYKLKKRLVEALYPGVIIEEVRR